MTNEQLEQLLYEEEGAALDFKRDQYPFARASNDDKSELLKDILAFCNSWRRATAYILIGVEEVKGGRSKPVGVADHLDDADLQQFVNSKTNRPVDFSYRVHKIDGMLIGVIEIPIQKRPVYLTKNFGRLLKDTVYIRRGSSTAEADPEEIARMAIADAGAALTPPDLEFQFADLDKRQLLGTSVDLKSLHLYPRVDPALLKPAPVSSLYGFRIPEVGVNPRYYEQFVEYVADSVLLNPVGFVIINRSGRTASGVEVKIQVPRQQGLHVVDEVNRPREPSRQFYMPNFKYIAPGGIVRPAPDVESYRDHYEIVIRFGKVLPKSTTWSTGHVYLGAEQSLVVHAVARTYAENIPDPVETPMQLRIQAEVRPMELERMQQLLSERSD